jgi:hypothetical protein
MKKYLTAILLVELLFTGFAMAELPTPWSDSQLLSSGKLEKCRETLSQILQFKIIDGRLQIDRNAWTSLAKDIEKGNPDASKSEFEKTQAEMAKQNP